MHSFGLGGPHNKEGGSVVSSAGSGARFSCSGESVCRCGPWVVVVFFHYHKIIYHMHLLLFLGLLAFVVFNCFVFYPSGVGRSAFLLFNSIIIFGDYFVFLICVHCASSIVLYM